MARLVTQTTDVGTATSSPPSSGTGLLGWLRGIYDRLRSFQNQQTTGTMALALASAASPATLNTGQGTNLATAAGNVLMHSVPDGHGSWSMQLRGTWDANSQVVFEGNDLDPPADGEWYSLNGRRNGDENTNDSTNPLDVNPSGGPGPLGGQTSHWRGNCGQVKWLRLRVKTLTAGQYVGATITTGNGVAAIFTNSAVSLAAPTSWDATYVSVGTGAVPLVAGLTARKTISIRFSVDNGASRRGYVGPTSAVGQTNKSYELAPGDSIELDIVAGATVYAVCNTGTNAFYVAEVAG